MREKSDRIFYNVDWFTVAIFLVLVVMGWMNIYSAVYDEAKSNVFDTSRQESKQMIFIGISIILAVVILIFDASFFTATAYYLFGFVLLLNIAVAFLGADIKGSHSWFKFGSMSLQPAEFAKWATGLAMAKYLSGLIKGGTKTGAFFSAIGRIAILGRIEAGLSALLGLKKESGFFASLGIIALPVLIMVLLQNETGCALVFVAFIFVMYREGIFPGWLLAFGMLFAVTFVLGIKFPGTLVSYEGGLSPAEVLEKFKGTHPVPKMIIKFDWTAIIIWTSSLLAIGIVRLLVIRRTLKQFILTAVVISLFTTVYVGSPIVLEKLPEHQSGRIKCWLGLPVTRAMRDRYWYNSYQSMVAIGSGGWTGKGYLQGTQTKFRFVPEQETDFIFCTVGEEWGFLGTSTVIILYLVLILRLIIMSERQRSDFTRIYGYGVAAIFFIHLIVNVGMTIGLLPVIGIPLPFFSYGGSSLISFTILLFIFVKLDSQRLLILR